MIVNRRGLLAAVVLAAGAVSSVQAEDKSTLAPLPVVTSTTILADLVREVGGSRVSVTSLVAPSGDVHVFTPSPADAKRVKDARLVVVNGLGLEGWLSRLVRVAGGKAVVVTATDGVKPVELDDHGHDHAGHDHADDHAGHDHGPADPHAWQDVGIVGKIYVGNILKALMAADPDGAEDYRKRAAEYQGQLAALDGEVRAAVASIPVGRRKIITSHEAFGYFARAYDLQFISPRGVSSDAEPSARDMAAIIRQIRAGKIPAVFLENMTDPRLMQRISSETGAKIGGTLYSDSLTAENGDAPTYIAMVRHNIKTLTRALAP